MNDEMKSVIPESVQQHNSEKYDCPILSIVMANYNCETYIKQSIDSVLSQSFSDFELIVVDDASSDTSVDIIREIALNDSRLRACQEITEVFALMRGRIW